MPKRIEERLRKLETVRAQVNGLVGDDARAAQKIIERIERRIAAEEAAGIVSPDLDQVSLVELRELLAEVRREEAETARGIYANH